MFRPVVFLLFAAVLLCAHAAPAPESEPASVEPTQEVQVPTENVEGVKDAKKDATDLTPDATHYAYAYSYPAVGWNYARTWDPVLHTWNVRLYSGLAAPLWAL